jgi:hypothetical protein
MAFEVPFPLAGEGAVLRFTLRDLGVLRSKYGDPLTKEVRRDVYDQPIDTFWNVILSGLDALDPVICMDLLEVGLKKAGGKERLTSFDHGDPGFSIVEAYRPLLDATALARTGKPHDQLVADNLKAKAELEAKLASGIAAEEKGEHPTTGSAPATT